MHANSIPELCLLKIFSRIPLRDLLQAGRVCTKWHWLHRSVGLKVTKLALLIGNLDIIDNFNYPMYPISQADKILNEDGSVMYPKQKFSLWNSLQFEWLDLEELIRMTVTFPNVTTLEIAFHMSSMFQLVAVIMLLRLWQSKLISFKLVLKVQTNKRSFKPKISNVICGPLFEAINSLSSLKHLSLWFTNSRIGSVQLDLPILAQLDKFHFISKDPCQSNQPRVDVLLDSFHTYARSNSKLRLNIEYFTIWNAAQLEDYYKLGHQICGQFETIPNINLLYLNQLRNFCDHFSSIITIGLLIDDLFEFPIRDVFFNLSQLSQLVHIYLCINLEDYEEVADARPLAQLLSVKSFRLDVDYMSNHRNLAAFNIAWTMPNLQIISVNIETMGIGHRRCALCGYDDFRVRDKRVNDDALVNCVSYVMMPLAECTQLHTISCVINFEHLYRDQIGGRYYFNSLTIEQLRHPLFFKDA